MNTIVSHRCIGYQRDIHGGLRSVFAWYWSNDTTTYSLGWTDEDGYECVSQDMRTRPHIDVDAAPGPQQGEIA